MVSVFCVCVAVALPEETHEVGPWMPQLPDAQTTGNSAATTLTPAASAIAPPSIARCRVASIERIAERSSCFMG
jgi:hypothetical protein